MYPEQCTGDDPCPFLKRTGGDPEAGKCPECGQKADPPQATPDPFRPR